MRTVTTADASAHGPRRVGAAWRDGAYAAVRRWAVPKVSDEHKDAVRRRIFLQGTDAHHYKFSSAVLEDYFHVSPAWRNRLLACGTQFLPRGNGNSPLVDRIRGALAG